MKTLIAFLSLLALAACSRDDHAASEDQAHGHEEAGETFERGPHNGRLLRDKEFAAEVTIFEAGVPPEFRVYLYQKDKPLPPTSADVRITLTRLDGETNTYAFAPEADFLRGAGIVSEPHSFDVMVTARQVEGAESTWTYASHEGRTTIAAATATSMGVETRAVGRATIRQQRVLFGVVQADPSRVADVRARYPGVIREVLVTPGAEVKRGATLAQVQSNESLQNYPLTAPITGTLVEHRASIGTATGDAPLFVIMDTSRVWVELDVFQRDLAHIRAGQSVELLDLDGQPAATGSINRIGTLATHGSQSVQARVVIDNVNGALRPGQFVSARVNVAERKVDLAVERDALQTFRDVDVVFEQVQDTYEVRMLELGEGDATHVEVLGGLKPGARYVTGNSYLIKADIEKSGASHDH